MHIDELSPVADLDKIHIPTGWVMIEDLIRFLIYELRVEPRSEFRWDQELVKSEEKFREWTGRVPVKR
jgi:hypothetical protein